MNEGKKKRGKATAHAALYEAILPVLLKNKEFHRADNINL